MPILSSIPVGGFANLFRNVLSNNNEEGLPSYFKDGKAVIEHETPTVATPVEAARNWAFRLGAATFAVVPSASGCFLLSDPEAGAWIALFWLHAALCGASLVVRQHQKERMLVRRGNFVFAAKYQTERVLLALLASGASLCLFALALAFIALGRQTTGGDSQDALVEQGTLAPAGTFTFTGQFTVSGPEPAVAKVDTPAQQYVLIFELVGSVVCMAVSAMVTSWAAYNAVLARRAAASQHWEPEEMKKAGMAYP